MTALILDPLTKEILADLFQSSQKESGFVDAVSYRVDHEDWMERLMDLEHQRYLVLADSHYRLSFGALALLDDADAKAELARCERIFGILREHFRNPSTRGTTKRLRELATEIGISYEQVARTMQYLLDVSCFWSGGKSINWEDRETAFVLPSESIIQIKSFQNLVASVKRWFEPLSPTNNMVDAISPMLNVLPSAKTMPAAYPGGITWVDKEYGSRFVAQPEKKRFVRIRSTAAWLKDKVLGGIIVSLVVGLGGYYLTKAPSPTEKRSLDTVTTPTPPPKGVIK